MENKPEAVSTARAAEARVLYAELSDLRARMVAATSARMATWAPALRRPEFAASAANMADWLALRGADIRALQPRLAALGLSTLGRAEGHVRASVDAVLASLALIAGAGEAVHPAPEVFVAGRALLAARRDALFGGRSVGPRTRIMATLPTEAAKGKLVARLLAAGVDCVRINCAHDTASVWAAMVRQARAAAAKAGRQVVVQMDLAGPKLHLQEVRDPGKGRLHPGDHFVLTAGIAKADRKRAQARLSHPEVLARLEKGRQVWINDGKLGAVVVETAPGRVLLEVNATREKGEHLRPGKGVNLPGLDLAIAALTDTDLAALDLAIAEADLIGFSFVQTVGDVESLLARIAAARGPRPLPGLVLKIETPLALGNLPDLIAAAAGKLPVAVMVARGDLAVEVGFERLPEAQDEILWLCEAAQVPVIWAAQVHEWAAMGGQPGRAETTDAAMAQRAECVMLNKGGQLVEDVTFLREVLVRMDRHQDQKSAQMGALGLWRATPTKAERGAEAEPGAERGVVQAPGAERDPGSARLR